LIPLPKAGRCNEGLAAFGALDNNNAADVFWEGFGKTAFYDCAHVLWCSTSWSDGRALI
jgi:hypothetical protein